MPGSAAYDPTTAGKRKPGAPGPEAALKGACGQCRSGSRAEDRNPDRQESERGGRTDEAGQCQWRKGPASGVVATVWTVRGIGTSERRGAMAESTCRLCRHLVILRRGCPREAYAVACDGAHQARREQAKIKLREADRAVCSRSAPTRDRRICALLDLGSRMEIKNDTVKQSPTLRANDRHEDLR